MAKVAMREAAQSSAASSWSGATTAAALPPSSRVTCLRGADSRIDQPTGTDPVKETTGSRGSCTNCAATSLGTGSTDQTPAGSSVSARTSPSSSADSGVAGASLTTIGAPAAIAGTTLCATRLSGKLNGAMPSTGPRGTRRTSAIRPVAAGSVSSPLQAARPAPRLLGAPAERRHGTGHLEPGPLERLAGLRGDQRGDLLAALGQPTGHVVEGGGPRVGGERRTGGPGGVGSRHRGPDVLRSQEHTSELQSRQYLVCRLLLGTNRP